MVLVIETTGLDPRAELSPTLALDKDARITERIYLQSAGALAIDVMVTAPELAPAPIPLHLIYQRDRTRPPAEFSWCVDDDRSLDPVKGTARFDMTPPADLPPPPG